MVDPAYHTFVSDCLCLKNKTYPEVCSLYTTWWPHLRRTAAVNTSPVRWGRANRQQRHEPYCIVTLQWNCQQVYNRNAGDAPARRRLYRLIFWLVCSAVVLLYVPDMLRSRGLTASAVSWHWPWHRLGIDAKV